MFGTNGNVTATGNHHVFEGRLDTLKEGIKKLAVKISSEPAAARVRAVGVKAADWIKAHPFIATGIALGIAVVVVRGFAARREKSWTDEREPQSTPR